MTPQIKGFTLAVTDMDKMKTFYSNVFNVNFEAKELGGEVLYEGKLGQLDILLCPAALAKNTAKQNRHQFDIWVTALDDILENTRAYGGHIMAHDHPQAASIKDPDGNDITLHQRKTK